MATLTKDFTAIGHNDTWVLDAGSSKVQAVGADDSDDTSYIRTTTVGNTQTYYAPDITSGEIADIDTIDSVEITATLKRAGGAGTFAQPSLVVSNNSTDSEATVANVSTSYATRTRTMTTDPITGSAWTVATLRAWQTTGTAANRRSFGVQLNASDGQALRCTRLTMTITYTAGTPVTEYQGWGIPI